MQVTKDYYYKQVIEPKWSPDSQHFVTRWDNKVRIFKVELDNVTMVGELEHKSKEKMWFTYNDVWDITFSPDGKYLAVGFCKYEIQLWEFETKKKLKMVKGCAYTNSDNCCIRTAFSPDGKYFAVRWEKTCRIYETETQSLFTEVNVG